MRLSVDDILQVDDLEDIDLQDWLCADGRPHVEVMHYSSDGWDIEAMLVLPANWERKAVLPTLVYLHGGPECRNSATWKDLASARGESASLFLASYGYAVFLPNFRGSSGYGQQFMDELQDYQLMKKPFRDVMAGVDALVDQGVADAGRLGIYGTSYGAQLAAWAISQTDRFRASVLSVGRYDTLVLDRCSGRAFHSLEPNRQGNSGPLDMWLKPEVYRHLSPMHHVVSIRTPAMVIETGAERKDLQARMLFNALQALEVESYWIYYPDAFHNGRWNDAYKRDYMTRLLAWWEHGLKGIRLPASFNSNVITIEAGYTGTRPAEKDG
jgi:dipeptidyl aminopeptidase/acylaminoacyl peptidase